MVEPWAGYGSSFRHGWIDRGINNGSIACISEIISGGANVWWRSDPGDDSWSEEPILAFTYAGTEVPFHTHLDGGIVILTNGKEVWRSEEYGAEGSWDPA